MNYPKAIAIDSRLSPAKVQIFKNDKINLLIFKTIQIIILKGINEINISKLFDNLFFVNIPSIYFSWLSPAKVRWRQPAVSSKLLLVTAGYQ